ncbi:hypothetical protein SAMN05421810_101174 [Amycolatopsis arida]|uniref:VOC domain-containing protein n=1 Tax=Amycolatopsis arida TaxID=587909 RepID=A0A1I5KJ13_9PSEU|nr:VOC family protein [Amycolatopsis arida]TDX97070.1 hypothetical protein CLV69_102172 [Amycolatopsis arida]SFO85005.1 hypothetical protein SAMN05421810_101174 [Amycolatopsis arida]
MSLGMPDRGPVLRPGTPCWVELATPDEARAQHFYAALLGWRYDTRPDPVTGRYAIASLGGEPAAGLYLAGAGQPSGWTVHLAVGNIDAVAEWVPRLGGRRVLGPADIPHRGTILHATDRSGAPVVFWQLMDTWRFAVGVPGAFAGADLNTHDGAAADVFYCHLFGYTSMQIGGDGLDYAEWRLDHLPVLYRYVMGSEYEPTAQPHWMVYFLIDPARGTDSVAAHATMLGGRVVAPPFDTPYGRTAVLADPGGATFSVIDHTTAVDGWGRAEVDDPYDD